jgi:N-acetylglucosamine kinase-like BadF-type ATPase
MILIADSGATKTEWRLIDGLGTNEKMITSGINPFYQDSENIALILRSEISVPQQLDAVYFYGTGCINEEKQNVVKAGLTQVLDSATYFFGSDLLGAAYSLCQDQPGIACILGTGSNSCYYNGNEIASNVSPLGFILGDEGSGGVLSKKLISDVLKKQLPQPLIDDFFETYQITYAEILENVYKKPFPNRYLANYTKFLSKNIEHLEIQNIVINGFSDFVTRNLLQYPDIEKLPVHFTGSIAFHFEAQLRNVIEGQHLKLGRIERAPMDGLIQYHKNKITQK